MSWLPPEVIEDALLPFRTGRRLILEKLLEYFATGSGLESPWLLAMRMFARVKSADSLLEKAERKKIALRSPDDVCDRFPDVLGVRIITDSPDELRVVDRFLTAEFETVAKREQVEPLGTLGGRGTEYELRHHARGATYPFEVQLRTFFDHLWTVRSFHLFHKQPHATALGHAGALRDLGDALGRAEAAASRLPAPAPHADDRWADWRALPHCRRVNLIVVERGELFAEQSVLPLSGNDGADHAAIVAEKLALYERHTGAAIVECSCFDLSSFVLNEPIVRWPRNRWDRART